MKVELEEIRLGISALGQTCYAGVMDKKNPMLWKHKVDVNNDFIHAVITNWSGKKEVFRQGEYEYEVSVKKTKIKKK